jgi:hypothetical protein
MTAFTDSLGFNKGTAAFPADVTAISKFEVKLDLAAIIAARSAAGATALAAGDTLQVISAAGWFRGVECWLAGDYGRIDEYHGDV